MYVYVKVSEIMDPEAGHVHRDGVVLACEVLECCPWFEFADLDVYGNTTEEEADDLSTDPDELLELGESAALHTICWLQSPELFAPGNCSSCHYVWHVSSCDVHLVPHFNCQSSFLG